MGWGLSLYGQQGMVADITIAATVMAMLLAPIPSQLALSVRKATNHCT